MRAHSLEIDLARAVQELEGEGVVGDAVDRGRGRVREQLDRVAALRQAEAGRSRRRPAQRGERVAPVPACGQQGDEAGEKQRGAPRHHVNRLLTG